MICLIQFLVLLGLIILGLTVLVRLVKPDDALRRIGMLLVLLIVGPAIIAALIKEMFFPAFTAAWSAAKPVLVFAAWGLGFLLILWVVTGIIELYHNRSSGSHRTRPEQE